MFQSSVLVFLALVTKSPPLKIQLIPFQRQKTFTFIDLNYFLYNLSITVLETLSLFCILPLIS
eukprot:snap_masked-scaffold_50-processed-gene-0.11-mRNA-1 protein AED:1.00 eAED:1.00 QI:0/0/0/0/1/1/2/0/62